MNEGSKFDSAMMALVAIVVVCLVFGTIMFSVRTVTSNNTKRTEAKMKLCEKAAPEDIVLCLITKGRQ